MTRNKQAAIGCLVILAFLFLCGIVFVLIPTSSENGDVVSGTIEPSSTSSAAIDSATAITSLSPSPTSELIPSLTPISLPTRNPSPLPTSTPPVATLPLEIRSASGWTFTVDSIEQFPVIEAETKRYRPEHDVFAVFIGTLGNFSDEDSCLSGDEFVIIDANGNRYEMNTDLLDELKSRYERDYPGFFLGQCVDYDTTSESFLVFDVPLDSSLSLNIEDTSVTIGQLASYGEVVTSETLTPSPVPTLASNTDPQPTTSPQPEDTGDVVAQAILNTNANLRSGPGTDNEVVRVGTAGETYPVYARTFDGWLLLDTAGETWVASSLSTLDRELSHIPIWNGEPIAASSGVSQSNIANGLGVSRDDFYKVFLDVNGLFEFEFEPTENLSNGQPRVIGEMTGTKALIELIGPPNDLYRASLMTIMPTDPVDIVDISFVSLAFTKILFPTWNEADDWFTESLEETSQTGEKVTLVHEGKVLELRVIREVGIMLFSVTVEGYG